MGATRSADVVELLGRVPVFSTLEPSDLEQIAQLAVPRRFEPGQAVFREGDSSDTCYVVREGHARAVRSHGDGRTITLATFGPGDIFGELAMFEDERRSATVEAIENGVVLNTATPSLAATSVLAAYRISFSTPTVYNRLTINIQGSSALGFEIGDIYVRARKLGYETAIPHP